MYKSEIFWEEVGEMVFDDSVLSRAVVQNILSHLSSLRSKFTGDLVRMSSQIQLIALKCLLLILYFMDNSNFRLTLCLESGLSNQI
jgi:hypothetical protein